MLGRTGCEEGNNKGLYIYIYNIYIYIINIYIYIIYVYILKVRKRRKEGRDGWKD